MMTTLGSTLYASSIPIDRNALVHRHHVHVKSIDPFSSLSVGNGAFAFTADVTGLQTFPDSYLNGVPLGTQSQWAWHSFPNPHNYSLKDVAVLYEDAWGRKIPFYGDLKAYDAQPFTPHARKAAEWLRANPHRIDLGRIGLVLKHSNKSPAQITDISDINQTLELWNGQIVSQFTFDHHPVSVTTFVDPARDLLCVRVQSKLILNRQAGISIIFPAPKQGWRDSADWDSPSAHQTECDVVGKNAYFHRRLDTDQHHIQASWSIDSSMIPSGFHTYEFYSTSDTIELQIQFTSQPTREPLPCFDDSQKACKQYWQSFWTDGGAIDFTGSTDPRAPELERRIVLSQYLTAIQCAGSIPPQETGLTYNSWFGKPHLEMTWWHEAHFALWGHDDLLNRTMPWYQYTIDYAKQLAKDQGYAGVRWGKMIGPDGRDCPSDIASFLIWQQPHPIFFCELLYRSQSNQALLEKYRQIISETAEFMASYATWDEKNNRYILGPPLIPAQESYGRFRRTLINPTYELAYWHWALKIANTWRERLGEPRNTHWDHVADHLSKPTIRHGIYTAIEISPYTIYEDHPSMLQAFGWTPHTPLIDKNVMNKTLDDVLQKWDWSSTWGWDYPVVAMTAAKLGRPHDAVDALLMKVDKNRYLPNGHNWQSDRLTIYLPGNGGLLYATAMMTAGWDGDDGSQAPGFPKDGKWAVRHEGIRKAP